MHVDTHTQSQAYELSNGQNTFTTLDYMAPTPEWAVLGHAYRKGSMPQRLAGTVKTRMKTLHGGC